MCVWGQFRVGEGPRPRSALAQVPLAAVEVQALGKEVDAILADALDEAPTFPTHLWGLLRHVDLGIGRLDLARPLPSAPAHRHIVITVACGISFQSAGMPRFAPRWPEPSPVADRFGREATRS